MKSFEIDKLSSDVSGRAHSAENGTATKERAPETKISSPELSNAFNEAGLRSRTIEIPGGKEFPEAIIFDRPDSAKEEKLVRIYRGISHLDASVLE